MIGERKQRMTQCVFCKIQQGDLPATIVYEDADCIATSFPKFVGTLRALGARIDVES